MSTLLTNLRQSMIKARKERAELPKRMLSLVISDADKVVATHNVVTDENIYKIINKLIKSNEETIAAANDAGKTQVLADENAFLVTLLPKYMTVEEIKAALTTLKNDICAAKSDGMGTGLAIKLLKLQNMLVQGENVTKVIKEMRS